ncbi:GTPase ObgE [Caminibacter pacificus]|uniref:GTPase Obg n=1 Tax=Caminibacter pacificus TaxID=1424653 RepID=A0AAJ4RD55_9BACT|nr:GTPase ObgE [Caminibacter pacificus]QCI27646.1 GTPase ObgE [Caminibacter pacificus]ROR40179.1 GTP-binding protein [Caminibacter pacificus]
MFVDNIKLTVKSGKGGAGCVSFRREKFVPKGGPDGGDGGKGGDVIIECDNNTHTLSHFKGKRLLKAKNGRPGEGRKKHGADGEDLILKVPPGTIIKDAKTGEILLDMKTPGERKVLLEGGKGGLGNWHFRGPRRQVPRYAQPGEEGKELEIVMELKLIADVGLVGFPNAGKSTLISAMSNARPEIANYEFTTLTPKLGVVKVDEYRSFVMADIPGIIEGAHEGKGLGLEFLKHIERTKIILYVIDMASFRDPVYQLKTLQKELKNYSEKLASRNYAVALNKIDAVDIEKIEEFFEKTGINPTEPKYGASKEYPCYFDAKTFVLPISAASRINLDALKFALADMVERVKDEE